MPSTYAHRCFGADVLTQLPEALQKKIEPYRALYDIGLHGPDLLFYYKALQSNPVNRLGNAMHEQPGTVFFERARGVIRNAKNRDAALVYALGYICHFALDSTCHPYILARMKKSGAAFRLRRPSAAGDFRSALGVVVVCIGRDPRGDCSILKLGHDQCLPYLWNTSPRPQMTAAMMRMPTTPQRVEVLTVPRKD